MTAASSLRLLIYAASCVLGATSFSNAAEQALSLTPGQPQHIISEHIQFAVDSTGELSLSDVLAGRAGAFRRLPGKMIDLGFTGDTVWLKLNLINRTGRTGTWFLATNVNFMHWLEAYLVSGGGAELIVKDRENAPFSARRIPYRHVTGTFSLAAGEQASLVIGYRSRGSSSLPLTIETRASFFQRRIFETVKNTVFYTAAAAMVLFSLVFMPVAHRRLQLAYAFYLSWVVLYVAHMDGYTLQFLWPDMPRWNAFASLPLGYGIAAFAAAFAREFLGTRTENRTLDRLLLGIIGATAVLLLSALIVDNQWLKKFGFPYVCAVSLVLFGCGLVGMRNNRPGVRFFILGWLGIVAGGIFATFAHWKPGVLPVNDTFDFIRGGMLLQGFLLALAITEQLRSFRRERDDARRREIRALEENVALERSRAYAQALADARRAQLAGASHDLKQPLVSLRLMLRRAMGAQDSAAVTTMRRSIDYLEGLVRRYLDESSRPPSSGRPGQIARKTEGGELFEVAVVLDNVAAMFADEAHAKGGALRFARSSARVRGDPMAVMRIVSNFVSNAIKHSDRGQVLVGCRRQGARLRIEVHDLGPGLDDNLLNRLRQTFDSGAQAEMDNNGRLGLMITMQLISEYGYGFDVKSRKGRGTVFALILPLA